MRWLVVARGGGGVDSVAMACFADRNDAFVYAQQESEDNQIETSVVMLMNDPVVNVGGGKEVRKFYVA